VDYRKIENRRVTRGAAGREKRYHKGARGDCRNEQLHKGWCADFTLIFTVSFAPTAESVTVNDAGVAEPAAVNIVIWPESVLSVTPVVRLVPWVTAPPPPVP
jgi:hypothetical protein